MSQILQALATQNTSDPSALMDALVASGKISAERRQLLEMMMQPATATGLELEDDAAFDREAALPEPQATDTSHLDNKVQEMMLASAERIEWLESLTDRLGRALGACPECFGTLPDCAECDGDGASGSQPLSRTDFKIFVLPVLNRMRPGRDQVPKPVLADHKKVSTLITPRGETDHGTGTD